MSSRGTYGPNFFGYAVEHDINSSERALRRLKGVISEKREAWKHSPQADTSVFLLESHEEAHHQLLSSTPSGLLLWRLNQVLLRDIGYGTREAAKFGLSPALLEPTVQYFSHPNLRLRLELCGCGEGVASYIQSVFENLLNCLFIRRVFFGADVRVNDQFQALTLSDFAICLNRAFDWMAVRCGLSFDREWVVKGRGDSLVFPDHAQFNVHGIAEAHALAHELSLLHSYGDKTGFATRYDQAKWSPGWLPLEQSKANFSNLPADANWAALTRHRALLACTSEVDLSAVLDRSDPLFIEEQLPWLRFANNSVLDGNSLKTAVYVCRRSASQPIYGPESKWAFLQDFTAVESIEEFANASVWLGLDLQVYAFHKNLSTLAEYFLEYASGEKYCYDKINNKSLLNNYLVEFGDEFLWKTFSLSSVYPKLWDQLCDLGFARFQLPGMQAFCHLLNGATVRNKIAHFLNEQIPSPEILVPKFNRALARELEQLGLQSSAVFEKKFQPSVLLERLIENGRLGQAGKHRFLVTDNCPFIY